LGHRASCRYFSLILDRLTFVHSLACFTLGCVALDRKRWWWAGVALGSLLVTPQFGIAVAVTMLARRE
jgi:hypothetical protein